jgi:hypothetical protein
MVIEDISFGDTFSTRITCTILKTASTLAVSCTVTETEAEESSLCRRWRQGVSVEEPCCALHTPVTCQRELVVFMVFLFSGVC